MKKMLGLISLLTCSAVCVFAQTEATPEEKGPAIQISDSEAVAINQTINGYVQGAENRGRIETFDRKKGKIVLLRLDRIVTDDPERVAFPQPDMVAICGECTEVVEEKDAKGKPVEKETGDKYDVWFILKRGGITTSRVLDVVVRSYNGKPMYVWTKGADGKWSAALAPDAP